jgi:hypothetical protein
MKPQICPRCQKSEHVIAENTPRPGYCAACGVRILTRAYREIANPVDPTGIAIGRPDEPPEASEIAPPLTYIGSLLRRIRVWRGGVPSPGEPSNPYEDTPVRWALFVYTWFPLAASVFFLVSLPAAIGALLLQEDGALGPIAWCVLGAAFLATVVFLAACLILRRARHRFPD